MIFQNSNVYICSGKLELLGREVTMKIENPKYQNAEYLVDMVIKRKSPAVVLESEGGLGKSYMVQSMVEKQIPDHQREDAER